MSRVLVLMTRLSDYMLNCLTQWHLATGVEIHIVRRQADSAAPFTFGVLPDGMTVVARETLDDKAMAALASNIDPQMILCFGWSDAAYLSTVQIRKPSCTAVMTMDNQWLGTWRQYLGMAWSRMKLKPLFDHVWVPGPRQKCFARKLGFSDMQIHEGLYVANAANFEPIWQGLMDGRLAKRLIFMGRYTPDKGLDVLWQAFIAYHAQTQSRLELWCVGTGALDAVKPDHPRIRHLGFIQPADLAQALSGGGIFVLPSRFEPWGLVVHEFALAGFPLVLSRHVGAADLFLGTDNGILLDDVTQETLLEAIARIDACSREDLRAMSQASRIRGETLDTASWIDRASAFMGQRV